MCSFVGVVITYVVCSIVFCVGLVFVRAWFFFCMLLSVGWYAVVGYVDYLSELSG